MDKQVINQIKSAIDSIFKFWPVSAQIDITEEDGVVHIDIKTDKDWIFINPTPEPLLAIQHIMRLIVKQQIPDQVIHLSINIGDFHQRQKNALVELAKSAIAKVKQGGIPVYLPPMSSFERRIIHLYIAEIADGVSSQSIGNEPNRRLIIKA